MKKIIFLFLFALLILVGIALAPQLLKLEQVQETIADQLQARFGNRMSTGQIQWDWLPIPHLSLRDARLVNDRAVCILPEVIIQPRWSSLIRNEITIKKIVLNHPRIQLKMAVAQKEKSDWSLPPTKIIVNNGTVIIDDDLRMVGFAISAPLQFAIDRGEMVFAGNWLHFNVAARSAFANHLNILGKLDIAQNAYIARITCQGLQLHNVATIAHDRFVPVAEEVDLAAHIAGSGLDTITARLQAAGQSGKSGQFDILLQA